MFQCCRWIGGRSPADPTALWLVFNRYESQSETEQLHPLLLAVFTTELAQIQDFYKKSLLKNMEGSVYKKKDVHVFKQVK